MTPDPIALRLRAIREQSGLTLAQVQLRSKRKLMAGAVGSYERGDRQPGLDRLRQIASFFDCDLAVLQPGDVVIGADKGDVGVARSWCEWVVVHPLAEGAQLIMHCADKAEAHRLAASIPTGRVGSRVHRVGDITYADGAA